MTHKSENDVMNSCIFSSFMNNILLAFFSAHGLSATGGSFATNLIELVYWKLGCNVWVDHNKYCKLFYVVMQFSLLSSRWAMECEDQ